jgi:hypothetical protein
MTGPASDKWKHFERLVVAIHQAADQGADVRWNEKIGGRQFDVTIRFRRGLYDYLTVVECKDYEKPVPIEKVDAFVTKAADAHADHAVLASASGFQQGAQEVARKHNVTLIHVTDSSDIDLSSMFGAQWGELTDTLHIQSIELEYTDGERKRLPEEAHAMTYYVEHVIIECGAERATLNAIVEAHSPGFVGGEIDAYQDYIIPCPVGTRVIEPDDGEIPLKSLASIHVRAGMTRAKTLRGPLMFDPYLLVPDLKVRNVATGEEKTFSRDGLKLGFNTTFTAGTFYEQPRLAYFYYCDHVEGDTATLYLVESFQLGRLIRAKLAVKTEYANLYVPVTDKASIQRLQRRLSEVKALEATDKNQQNP